MRLNPTRSLAFLALVSSLAAAVPALGKGRTQDAIWVRPDFARLGVDGIAVLPPVTFDNSFEAQNLVAQTFAQSFRETGYRWISSSAVNARLRALADGSDSLLKRLSSQVLARARVDSAEARARCADLAAGAILSLRVDQWEQVPVDFNQAGAPYTVVAIRAALVDSTGRLLWTASGNQRGEGSYHDPNAGANGVTQGDLNPRPITAQAGPPTFPEVLVPLFTRWASAFPARAAADTSQTSRRSVADPER